MRRRLILIAATWAAVVGLVVGNAHAQSPTPPDGQFVLVGVVVLEGGRALAWVQEPTFTDNKVVTVRLGDSVGPYRVTKILTHQVEFTGPGGMVSVPLAGLPGAVSVASSDGTGQPPADEMPPPLDLSNHNVITLLPGDPRKNFPASRFLVGAGAVITGVEGQTWQLQAAQMQAASAPALPQASVLNNPPVTILLPDDPRQNFPTSKMLIGG